MSGAEGKAPADGLPVAVTGGLHVLVTGAGGFIGRGLVARLLADATALPRPLALLTAVDRGFAAAVADGAAAGEDPRLRRLQGDIADAALLQQASSPPPDIVFHLASVPGSLAEKEPALGLQANLMAPLALLQQLADSAGTAPPRVVFASSVAVYGARHQPGGVLGESARPRPSGSYGAHKLMTEILLADLSRRGQLDGVSLRLPGIVARPPQPTGHGSAFMSDLIRRLMAGEPYDCPVSAAAQAWWMSLPCCIDNLLHAAALPGERLESERCVQLPVLTATVAAVAAACEALHGGPAQLRWQPLEHIEATFGRQPRLDTPVARALGFTDDGSLAQLVQRAVQA